MSEPKKKTPAARPKLQTPTPKKRQPVKRKAEHSDAIRSVATPAPAPSPAKKQNAMLHGAIWVLVLGVTGYIALALATFDNRDPSLFFLRNIPNTGLVHNKAGLAGAYLADLAYASLGLSAWWVVVGGLVWLFRHLRSQDEAHSKVLFGIGLAIILFFMPVVERLLWEDDLSFILQDDAGGWVGKNTTDLFLMYLGRGGSLFVLGVVLVAGFKLMVQFSYRELGSELWTQIKATRDYIFERNSQNEESDTIAPKTAEIKQPWLKRVSGSLKGEKSAEQTKSTEKAEKIEKTEKTIDKNIEKTLEQSPEKKEKPASGSLKKLANKIVPKKKAKPSTRDNPNEAAKAIAADDTVETDVDKTAAITPSALSVELAKLADAQEYVLPSVNLLAENQDEQEITTLEMLMPTGELIVEKLAEFGIKVEIVNAFRGPVITRFEIRPNKGVKGSQIMNLSKDLARSMAVESVRVVETIQGKDTMGIELPNEVRRNVLLRDIVGHKIFRESASKLTVSLGANIVGNATIADLAKMPHVLVGGMTGSGKSVGVNAMIMSLLFKATPDEVRLIMIDPKMLELSVYEGIPHLLCPVVTDMREAGNVLNWCVAEMEKRYRLLSHLGVRNLASYNAKIQAAFDSGEPISNPFSLNPEEPEPLEVLPQIVIVIDELADLMMTEKKAVEVQITRIAQKSRAAGMHMIIATQRPSVDVITGLIKANVPTRMAFTVQSKIDSRTILDSMGAEDLLKNGDLLFMSPGNATPTRLQSPFVSDEEVHDVVTFIKAQGEPNYVEGLLTGEAILENQQFLPPDMLGKVHSDKDELFGDAVNFVLESRKTSISSLQRALRIGYNRAANIMQQMEDEGIVSSVESNGTRRILRARD